VSLDGLSRLSVETNSRPYGQNRRRYGAKQNFAERSNRMNRTYEIMFIVRPDVEEADLDKLIEGFSANVVSGGGEVRSVEKMGRRRLAYTVRKFNDGFYVLLNVSIPGAGILEIERRMRVTEQVIKFITVRMDEEEKRLAKVKALRDTKVKRSAQPIAAPVQQAPAVAAPVEEHVAHEAAVPAAVAVEAPADAVSAEA
jgi:small subunit ribosomal protein S6